MSYSIGFLRFCKQVGTRWGASAPLPSDERSPGGRSLPCCPAERALLPRSPKMLFFGGFIFPSEGGSSPSSPAPGQQQGAELAVLSSDSLLSQGLLPLQS